MGKKTDLIEKILSSKDGKKALKAPNTAVLKKKQEEPSFSEADGESLLTLEEFNSTQLEEDEPKVHFFVSYRQAFF